MQSLNAFQTTETCFHNVNKIVRNFLQFYMSGRIRIYQLPYNRPKLVYEGQSVSNQPNGFLTKPQFSYVTVTHDLGTPEPIYNTVTIIQSQHRVS